MPQMEVDAEIELSRGSVQLVQIDHPGPSNTMFQRDGIFWVDLCLTPRRPTATARYIDHWGSHRFSPLGSLMALPPNQRMHLRNTGGRHASVLCQLQAESVREHTGGGFEWTDRRLEACLHIASERIRWLMLRLNQELRYRQSGTEELCELVVRQLAIELARYLESASETADKGGLATWRLRLIDERLTEPGASPSLADLAKLCNLSVRQLTRAFRVSRGCSISNYIAEVRIDLVKRKLTSELSLSEIARALGYSSQANFASSFRRATGISPGMYRSHLKSAMNQEAGSTGTPGSAPLEEGAAKDASRND